MASISLEVQPFPIPDRIVIKMPPGRKEDEAAALPTMKLADVSEEVLAIMCEEFTAAVFAAAGKSL